MYVHAHCKHFRANIRIDHHMPCCKMLKVLWDICRSTLIRLLSEHTYVKLSWAFITQAQSRRFIVYVLKMSDQQFKPFEYETSLTRGNNIRLVHLLSLDPSTNLEITLSEHCLDNATYDALSYVWGDDSETYQIICNKKKLKIRKNLYEALKAQQFQRTNSIDYEGKEVDPSKFKWSASHGRDLWVDAVCINQNDVAEKTH